MSDGQNQVVTHLKAQDELSQALDRAEGTVKKFGDHVQGTFLKVGAAIGVGLSINAIIQFGKESVRAASEAQDAEAKYMALRRASNEETGVSIDRIKELGASIQSLTKYEDDHVVAVGAMLLKYENLSGETFERTIKLATDMADVFGGLDSAANMLGRALNDPANAQRLLKVAGVELTDQVRNQIKAFKEQGDVVGAQNLLFKELEGRFGGVAEAMGDTFSGKLAKLNNQWGDVKETIGGALIPAIERVLPLLSKFAKEFKATMESDAASLGPSNPRDGGSGKGKGGWWSNLMGGLANADLTIWGSGLRALGGGDAETGGGASSRRAGEKFGEGSFMQHFWDTVHGQRQEDIREFGARQEKAAGKPLGPAEPSKSKGLSGPDPFAPQEVSEEESKAAAKATEEWLKSEDEFAKWIAEEQEKRRKKILEREEIQRKSDDEYWDAEAKKTEEERKKKEKDESFVASFEGMQDVTRRIQEAAASKEAPEDKIIKNNSEEAAKNREILSKAADASKESVEKLEEINKKLDPGSLGDGGTGLA